MKTCTRSCSLCRRQSAARSQGLELLVAGLIGVIARPRARLGEGDPLAAQGQDSNPRGTELPLTFRDRSVARTQAVGVGCPPVFKTGRAEQPSAWMVRFHRRSVGRISLDAELPARPRPVSAAGDRSAWRDA